jgi:hypothetical protein
MCSFANCVEGLTIFFPAITRENGHAMKQRRSPMTTKPRPAAIEAAETSYRDYLKQLMDRGDLIAEEEALWLASCESKPRLRLLEKWLEEAESDRNEWRTQHENLLEIRRQELQMIADRNERIEELERKVVTEHTRYVLMKAFSTRLTREIIHAIRCSFFEKLLSGLEQWIDSKKKEITCSCSDCDEKRWLIEELEEKLRSIREKTND